MQIYNAAAAPPWPVLTEPHELLVHTTQDDQIWVDASPDDVLSVSTSGPSPNAHALRVVFERSSLGPRLFVSARIHVP